MKPKQYIVGIAPSHITTPHGPLFESTSPWRTVANAVSLYKYYGVQLVDVDWATNLDAKQFVDFAKKENVQIGCEFGGFLPGTPDASVAAVKPLDPVFRAGGEVSSIHLDGPIRRLIKGVQKHPNALHLSQITVRLIDFFRKIRAKYPDIRIGLITNFPNWDYTNELLGRNGHYTDKSKVTYAEALDAVHQALKKGGDRLDFVEVDCPYNYYRQKRTRNNDAALHNARKFKELQTWCEQRNIRFHLVINAEPGKRGARQFHDLTCEYVQQLRRDGIFPDAFIIQSWYRQPDRHLPETERNTFMNTAKDAITLIRKLYPNVAGEVGS